MTLYQLAALKPLTNRFGARLHSFFKLALESLISVLQSGDTRTIGVPKLCLERAQARCL
jgi:hypothetical protein